VWGSSPAHRGAIPTPPDEAAALARRQFGVVTRAQLLAAGMSASAIDRRQADRRLQRLHQGVFAVGHQILEEEGFWLAAVLACGEGAVLSHRSAAAAWQLRAARLWRVDVTSRSDRGRGQPGIHAHRCRLTPADVTTHRGVPITTPARTLLDLAEVVTRRDLDRALEEALRLRLVDHDSLARTIARAGGRRGLKRLRAALEALEPLTLRSRSELERRMLALVKGRGLPKPLVNAPLLGYKVDLLWPAHRLVVELDGYEYHHTPQAFDRDRRRDGDLQRAGYRVQRFSFNQVDRDPEWVAACLKTLLAESA
jgi:very-short-patch-repair endonuclease